MVRAESVPGSTVTAVRAAQIDRMHPEKSLVVDQRTEFPTATQERSP
jgi:hypothetical protein